MPFDSFDPTEHFESCSHISVPDDLVIPTDDDVAWETHKEHRWIYNKLEVALSQKIPCGPCGVYPEEYPIFMKPIMNIQGGGIQSYVIHSEEEYEKYLNQPGLMWMRLAKGQHTSHDFVLIDGIIQWHLAFKGIPGACGTFDYWQTEKDDFDGSLEHPPTYLARWAYRLKLTKWIHKHLHGFTGVFNCETIGRTIIEGHLRMGDIKRIGNPRLLEAVIELYQHHTWSFNEELPELFLFPLFIEHDNDVQVNKNAAANICQDTLSWQIFDDPLWQLQPPGGKRVAQICVDNYDKGIRIRDRLRKLFT